MISCIKKIILPSLLVLVLVGSSLCSVAQVTMPEIDERIIEMYGLSRAQEMANTQSAVMAYLNYYVQNGYQVLHDVPESKWIHFKDISEINYSKTGEKLTEQDIIDLNILKLDIVRKQEEYLTYRIGKSGTVIVFIAPIAVIEQFNSLK